MQGASLRQLSYDPHHACHVIPMSLEVSAKTADPKVSPHHRALFCRGQCARYFLRWDSALMFRLDWKPWPQER